MPNQNRKRDIKKLLAHDAKQAKRRKELVTLAGARHAARKNALEWVLENVHVSRNRRLKDLRMELVTGKTPSLANANDTIAMALSEGGSRRKDSRAAKKSQMKDPLYRRASALDNLAVSHEKYLPL